MKLSKLLSLGACLLTGGLLGAKPAQATMTRTLYPAHGSTLGYILYTPPDFTTAPAGTKFPVLLFLHGSGENGDGSATGLAHIENTALPKRLGVTHDLDLEAVVIAPQSSSGYWLADGLYGISTVNQAHDVLAEVETTNTLTTGKCDTNRVYVSGLSAGGQGTYLFLKKYFSEVAAIAPVSPSDALDATTAASVATSNKPVWSFQNFTGDWPATSNSGPSHAHIAHAYNASVPDYPTYNATEGYVDANDTGPPTTGYISGTTGKYVWTQTRDYNLNYHPILDGGLTTKNQLFTLYPSAYGHDTWDLVYYTANFYNWLFGQTLNGIPPGTGTGTGLTGVYYNGTNFNTYVTNQTDSTVNFNWGAAAPLTGVNADNFTVRWTGQIQAVETGNYYFGSTVDDGVRIKVNNVTALDQFYAHYYWSTLGTTAVPLVAGQKYDITVEYVEFTSNAAVSLEWKRPGASTATVVPTTQLYPTGFGLKGDYYSGTNFNTWQVSQIDPAVNFNWGTTQPKNLDNSLMSGMPADNFTVRWTGKIQAVESGNYYFGSTVDDGVKITVNGVTALDQFYAHYYWTTLGTTAVPLVAGQKYNITVEYVEFTGSAAVSLEWKRPGASSAVVVPSAQLYALPAGGGMSPMMAPASKKTASKTTSSAHSS